MSGWLIAAAVWVVLSVPVGIVVGKALKRRDGR